MPCAFLAPTATVVRLAALPAHLLWSPVAFNATITRVLIGLEREVWGRLRPITATTGGHVTTRGVSTVESILILAILVTVATVTWIVPDGKARRYHVDAEEFRCRLELISGIVSGLRIGQVRRARATWCHTALLLHRHGPWAESWALGVRFPTGALERVGGGPPPSPRRRSVADP